MTVFAERHMKENVIRGKMEQVLKAELRTLALKTRAEMNLTQEKMGNRYVMSGDSFGDIESGENMCGALTEFLLLRDQEDLNRIFKEIGAKLDKIREEEMVTW